MLFILDFYLLQKEFLIIRASNYWDITQMVERLLSMYPQAYIQVLFLSYTMKSLSEYNIVMGTTNHRWEIQNITNLITPTLGALESPLS